VEFIGGKLLVGSQVCHGHGCPTGKKHIIKTTT